MIIPFVKELGNVDWIQEMMGEKTQNTAQPYLAQPCFFPLFFAGSTWFSVIQKQRGLCSISQLLLSFFFRVCRAQLYPFPFLFFPRVDLGRLWSVFAQAEAWFVLLK